MEVLNIGTKRLRESLGRSLVLCLLLLILVFAGACTTTRMSGKATGTTLSPLEQELKNLPNTPSPAVGAQGATNSSTTQATSPPTTNPPETSADQAASYEAQAQSVTIAQMANDPSAYADETVAFTGVIANFLQDSSGNTTAMNVSDPNSGQLVYVELSMSADPTQMSENDTVQIWGEATGALQGKNGFGGTINEASVGEMYLTDETSGSKDNDPNQSIQCVNTSAANSDSYC